jgi:endonuclease/exonuclease/phosphatase family metal-dependent hydrolase
MRFLLYNLRYCTGTSAGFHLPFPGSGYLRRTARTLHHITRFIQSQRPDIVGLIEVDGGSYRSRRTNQAEVIAQALGHFHCYASKYGTRSLARALPVFGKQINAFLTSRAVHTERFHYFERGVKRLVIELELQKLVLFLVHLSLKYRHRQDQLRHLFALVRSAKKPCIVAGDFNARWGEREIELFLAASRLQNASPVGAPSYPSWEPRKQLDFILHSSEIRILDFKLPRVTFSDHLPLICDFDIGK